MNNLMQMFQLGDSEFIKFKDLIYTESGIKLSDMKKALVQARLSKRLRVLQLSNFKEYHSYLINNYEDEKIEFVNAITTNKTNFFRENKHFEFLRNTVLPGYLEKKKDSIRIWSAGCSSGEEPYSILITLLEFYKNRTIPDIKILATDIDTNMLKHAEAGVYSDDVVRDIDMSLLKNYFYKGKGDNEGFYKIKDQYRKYIYFRRLNLLTKNYPMKKSFDILFCRNVVIYFDKKTQIKLFNKYYDYIEDDGYLFIGHSENLSAITKKFTLLGNTVYKKNLSEIDSGVD